MTERKPDNVSWESWIERQIQDGQRSGAFDRLNGHGRPIDGLTSTHDDMWWVKAKLREEKIDYLPPTIAIRADRASAIDAAMKASTEDTARRIIGAVNARIRRVNSHATAGPPSTSVIIDIETLLERWRSAHPVSTDAGNEPAPNTPGINAEPRRWWHCLVRPSRSR